MSDTKIPELKKISELLYKLKWVCENQVKNTMQGIKEMRQEEL